MAAGRFFFLARVSRGGFSYPLIFYFDVSSRASQPCRRNESYGLGLTRCEASKNEGSRRCSFLIAVIDGTQRSRIKSHLSRTHDRLARRAILPKQSALIESSIRTARVSFQPDEQAIRRIAIIDRPAGDNDTHAKLVRR